MVGRWSTSAMSQVSSSAPMNSMTTDDSAHQNVGEPAQTPTRRTWRVAQLVSSMRANWANSWSAPWMFSSHCADCNFTDAIAPDTWAFTATGCSSLTPGDYLLEGQRSRATALNGTGRRAGRLDNGRSQQVVMDLGAIPPVGTPRRGSAVCSSRHPSTPARRSGTTCPRMCPPP